MRRWFCCALIVAASACASSQTSPASPAAAASAPSAQSITDFTGTWTMKGTITVPCSDLKVCAPAGTSDGPYTLRTQQTGRLVTGVLSNSEGVLTELSGSVDESGQLTASGSLPWSGPGDCPGGYKLDNFTVSLKGGVTGGYTLATTSPGEACFPRAASITSAIASFAQVSTAPLSQNVIGAWSGWIRLTTCTADLTKPCSVGSWSHDGVSFSATAAGLEAHLTSYAWSADAAIQGDAVVLTGGYSRDIDTQHLQGRVTASSLHVDNFGRLTGAFTFHNERYQNGVLVSAADATIELLRFAIRP